MIDLSGKVVSLSRDYRSRKPVVSFEINEDLSELEELGDADVRIKVSKRAGSRSLDSNAYFYVLVNKLAEKLRISDMEVHDRFIRDNTCFVLNDDGVIDWKVTHWTANKFDLYHEGDETYLDTKMVVQLHKDGNRPLQVDGRPATGRVFFHIKGSHQMDSKEMSRLIDSVVTECKEQGITTETPEEIARMNELWKRRHGRR